MSTTEFKSAAAVYRWLLENGRQISESQFYDHVKEGLLRKKRGTKVFTLAAVKRYAKLNTKDAGTGEKEKDVFDKMAEEKAGTQLSLLKVKLAEKEHWLKVKAGKVISREDFEAAVVGRAVAFMAQLSHMVHTKVPDWIDLVGGDQAKAPAMMEAMTEQIAQRMSAFSADVEFEVILEGE